MRLVDKFKAGRERGNIKTPAIKFQAETINASTLEVEETVVRYLRIGDKDGNPGCHNNFASVHPYIKKGWRIVGFINCEDKAYQPLIQECINSQWVDGAEEVEREPAPKRGLEGKLSEPSDKEPAPKRSRKPKVVSND